ncbi:MAG TPA: glycine/betaine ABC transporter ATP-binding protein [Pelotomaculum sp.]|nr:glycine/betaine ABC transporter ATP-binding protein [Pelotomaculum sp.]
MTTEKIILQDLVKVFGEHPEKALSLLHEGFGKEEILAKTGQTVGVNKVSFTVQEGETFVLMGLSGSGKSTVLRCINRLIRPTEGKVLIDGENITTIAATRLCEIRRKKLGMVFQRFALFPHRTVLDNVAYGLEIQGINKELRYSKARELLEVIDLKNWANAYPGQLSGGMQQRVGLARALVSDPDILLMDEAFSALDPLIRREMQNELLSLQSKLNKTIIFVTHDLDEALKIGDRIALMKDGSIIQIGTPEEILTKPADEYVERFIEGVDRTKVLTAEGIMKDAETISLKDGPRVALRKMREMGISSIFVLNRERKLVGLVTADTAWQAKEDKDTELSKIMLTDFPTAAPDTPLIELIPLLAETKFPVAIVNEEEKLLGIVVRGTLLAALAN